MIDILDVPTERDLPADRAARMRAALVTAAERPRPAAERPRAAAERPHPRTVPERSRRQVRLRIGVAVATVAALAASGMALLRPSDGAGTETLAFGPDELSLTLRHAVEQCLEWTAPDQSWPVSMADLAVAAERDGTAVVLFMSDTGYVTCDAHWAPTGEILSGGAAFEAWPQRDWLPGTIDRLLLSSTEVDGGDVTVTGRVSARVHRLVLEHGDGHGTTTARLVRGAFGLLTTGAGVNKNAQMVSYDADGREIDRRPLFPPHGRYDRCYKDPAGNVVYGKPGPDCGPADPWER